MWISWAIFAAFANEINRKNLLKQGYLVESQLDQTLAPPSQPNPTESPAIKNSQFIADELTKLAKLRESGVLTEAEFNAQKKKLLL